MAGLQLAALKLGARSRRGLPAAFHALALAATVLLQAHTIALVGSTKNISFK